MNDELQVGLFHGAGYTGGELIRLLIGHPAFNLSTVTSRSFAGQPVWAAHPALRDRTALRFSDSETIDHSQYDAVFIAAEHGQSASIVQQLLQNNYTGKIIDLSADFRLKQPALYQTWYGYEHPAPALLDVFVYGMAETVDQYPEGTRFIANPGCFATGISLALWPITRRLKPLDAAITALTGASGSGARPKPTTHFPTRAGNVRAYKVLKHQHLAEIDQLLGPGHHLALTPVSGPWTRGIWGTAQITLPKGVTQTDVASWYEEAYGGRPLVRCWPTLPELRYSVGTPCCDLGWVLEGNDLVVGFALDNLLKGAASQAVQNLNMICGLPEATGLLKSSHEFQIS